MSKVSPNSMGGSVAAIFRTYEIRFLRVVSLNRSEEGDGRVRSTLHFRFYVLSDLFQFIM